MKKIFTLLMCAGMALAVSAQSAFVVSPMSVDGVQVMMLGERMSNNRTFVGGVDQASGAPALWNTVTNGINVVAVLDSTYINPADWEDYETPAYWDYSVNQGSFHAVNDLGMAVGSMTTADYVSHPIMFNAETGTWGFLYEGTGIAGSEAYGITNDGSTIVGFYFDESWTTTPCVWTGNGTVRTNLPVPTEAQVGFPVDYASARWISGDGNVILGYVQDSYSGDWVAVSWKKVDGNYTVQSFSNNFYQVRQRDENGNLILPETPNPYFNFEPIALSDNGEWVSLALLAVYDENDWDAYPMVEAGRYNLVSGTFEVLDMGEDAEFNELEMFGIANNGTCVGRLTGALDWETMTQPVDALVWMKDSTTAVRLFDLFENDSYVAENVVSAASYISGDAAFVMGYASDDVGNQTTFYVQIQDPDAIVDHVVANVNVYPNPASAMARVEMESNINSIRIINTMGQVVYSENGINNTYATINTSNLPNGLYIVNVVTENGVASTRLSIVR